MATQRLSYSVVVEHAAPELQLGRLARGAGSQGHPDMALAQHLHLHGQLPQAA